MPSPAGGSLRAGQKSRAVPTRCGTGDQSRPHGQAPKGAGPASLGTTAPSVPRDRQQPPGQGCERRKGRKRPLTPHSTPGSVVQRPPSPAPGAVSRAFENSRGGSLRVSRELGPFPPPPIPPPARRVSERGGCAGSRSRAVPGRAVVAAAGGRCHRHRHVPGVRARLGWGQRRAQEEAAEVAEVAATATPARPSAFVPPFLPSPADQRVLGAPEPHRPAAALAQRGPAGASGGPGRLSLM